MALRVKQIRWYVYGNVEKRGSHMVVTMSGGQAVQVAIDTTDAQGVHQPVDGKPVWTSGDPAKLVVSPSLDGYGALVAAKVGALGAVTITVTADGDLGPGIRTISGSLDFDLTPVNAATEIRFTVGQPY